ncbi:MAG TPA: FAD-dependent oxidoreductase [Bryobacteraceae bacterium]|nr:FAD-dependent oxidoreductase [Bryobacteraceae bacterium]
MKIAVAGAGIYGATAAIRLAESGHRVHLFDPLGLLHAASAINQYRVHAGYHYPRSAQTIAEVLEARNEFVEMFRPAIVRNSRNYYAIPKQGSLTRPDEYERLIVGYGLPLRNCRPDWLDYEFIDRCYEVDEQSYDPELLRAVVKQRAAAVNVQFEPVAFHPTMRNGYDFIVWATYGMGESRSMFSRTKYQVAEKVLIQLPRELQGIGLVVVDGPFTAFDPYGESQFSQFGSAKHTNHWSTTDPDEAVPELYADRLNSPEFAAVPFSRFEEMRADACLAVPAAAHAQYLGSRFVMRVVEDSLEDRRILSIKDGRPGEIHIFSGKVVSAVKAARLVCERIGNHA